MHATTETLLLWGRHQIQVVNLLGWLQHLSNLKLIRKKLGLWVMWTQVANIAIQDGADVTILLSIDSKQLLELSSLDMKLKSTSNCSSHKDLDRAWIHSV